MRMTEEYLRRPADGRFLRLIEAYVPFGTGRVLDLGCGAGQYGPALRPRAAALLGYDHDPALCAKARETGAYDEVIAADLAELAGRVAPVDVVFCGEVLEHFRNSLLPAILESVESVSRRRIVFTVPNPWSPHFRSDPTHVLLYTVPSLLRFLNRSGHFTYRVRPMGFSDENLRRPALRWINPVARRLALCSPTVCYVGERRGDVARAARPL